MTTFNMIAHSSKRSEYGKAVRPEKIAVFHCF
jgi:hypothetical protein